jgi:putative ATP-dependent endonuclease of OLD family
MRLNELPIDAQRYFQRLPGYDTLRLVLCRKAILVEGPSDELVLQKVYQAKHSGKLPIQDGVDVISVGTSFLRFLELSKRLKIETSVVSDNDGDVEALQRKYAEYINPGIPGIRIYYDTVVDEDSVAKNGKTRNHNTLEPKILKANSLATMNSVFGTSYDTAEELIDFMLANKTECALAIFETDISINSPDYIDVATT